MIIHCEEKEMTLEDYIKEKLRMLQEDFYLKLTEEEINHMRSLTRDIDVDHYAHTLFTTKL